MTKMRFAIRVLGSASTPAVATWGDVRSTSWSAVARPGSRARRAAIGTVVALLLAAGCGPGPGTRGQAGAPARLALAREPLAALAWLAVGDRQIHLIEDRSAGRRVREQISRSDHLAMEVDDLEVVKARLKECGISFALGGNERLGMSQAFCSDPDGHTIEFVQYD